MSAIVRLALPVLAVASTAFAASCSTSATATIQNGGDATSLATCTTFSGSIAIATQGAGDIALNGIKKITGTLFAENNNAVTSLSGDSLESVGDFTLQNTTAITSISFPKLTTVGTIKWISVSKLNQVTAPISKADNIDIENTELQEFPTFNLTTINGLTIVNNRFISKISLALTNITGALIVQGNEGDLSIELLSLQAANNITVQSSNSFNAPLLTSLGDSLVLRTNVFESFSTPNLTKVGNALVVADNNKLTNISFPELVEVSKALIIANNTLLSKINDLGKLKKIGADLDFHGNFSEVSLPSLTSVGGSFNIQSTGDIQKTCDSVFKPMSGKQIQGKYQCVGQVINPGGIDSKPSTTGTGGTTKPTGAAASVHVQQGLLGFAGIAAAAFFL
jgi:hypothetical protein